MAFFKKFPELEHVEAWLLEHAPWVKATLCFGFLNSWEFDQEGVPRVEITSLERAMFLNVEEPENCHLTELLNECRELRHRRWASLK